VLEGSGDLRRDVLSEATAGEDGHGLDTPADTQDRQVPLPGETQGDLVQLIAQGRD